MATIEEQLRNTQNELDKLRAEYQEFVYMISHDFSGPLRQIEGFSQIILRREAERFDEKTRKQFDLIIDASAIAKQQLDALLELSRIGGKGVSYSAVDCNEVVCDAKEELSEFIRSSGAVIDVPELPTIHGIEGLLRSCFCSC